MSTSTDLTSGIASALSLLKNTRDWRPAEGESLIGILEGVVPATGPFGDGNQIPVRDADDVIWRLWLTGYLRSQLAAYKAERGAEVGILFEGKGVSSSGRSFNRYQVVVGHGVSQPLLALDGGQA